MLAAEDEEGEDEASKEPFMVSDDEEGIFCVSSYAKEREFLVIIIISILICLR